MTIYRVNLYKLLRKDVLRSLKNTKAETKNAISLAQKLTAVSDLFILYSFD